MAIDTKEEHKLNEDKYLNPNQNCLTHLNQYCIINEKFIVNKSRASNYRNYNREFFQMHYIIMNVSDIFSSNFDTFG